MKPQIQHCFNNLRAREVFLYVLFSKPQRATHSTQDNAYDGAKNAQQEKQRLLSFSGHYPLLLCQALPTGWLPWL